MGCFSPLISSSPNPQKLEESPTEQSHESVRWIKPGEAVWQNIPCIHTYPNLDIHTIDVKCKPIYLLNQTILHRKNTSSPRERERSRWFIPSSHFSVARICSSMMRRSQSWCKACSKTVLDGKLFGGKIWSCSCKGWETMTFKMESLVRTESIRMESFEDIVQLFLNASFCQVWTLPNHKYLAKRNLISISSVGYRCPTLNFRRIPQHKICFKFSKTTIKSNT